MNPTQPSQVEVRLLGQRVMLKTAGDPEKVQDVVELVATCIERAEARVNKGNQAPHLVALLALMDLAEEYISAKAKFGEHQELFAGKARELESLIQIEIK